MAVPISADIWLLPQIYIQKTPNIIAYLFSESWIARLSDLRNWYEYNPVKLREGLNDARVIAAPWLE